MEQSRADGELARRFVGCSLHWERLGKPETLILISEDSAWWISDGIRGALGLRDLWRPESDDKIVCYLNGLIKLSIQLHGPRFTMHGLGKEQVEGDVVWPQR